MESREHVSDLKKLVGEFVTFQLKTQARGEDPPQGNITDVSEKYVYYGHGNGSQKIEIDKIQKVHWTETKQHELTLA